MALVCGKTAEASWNGSKTVASRFKSDKTCFGENKIGAFSEGGMPPGRRDLMTMPNNITPNALGFLIADSARLLRMAFEKRIAGAGLNITAGEARTLMQVAAVSGSRQLDIAARMGVEPMTVCTFLDKLQAEGLIERQQDPADRRAKKIVLTPRSDTIVQAINDEIEGLLAEATQGMNDDMRRSMEGALVKLRDNLQKGERGAREA